MDTKKFFSEIRSIIREEIDYALEKKLSDKSKKQDIETLKHGLNLYKEINTAGKSQQKQNVVKTKQQQKPNTKFGSIQDILNETKKSLQESYDMEEEFRFTSDMVGNFGGNTQSAAIPNGFSKDEIPTEVMSALTKDYSALMKKIDEKKGR